MNDPATEARTMGSPEPESPMDLMDLNLKVAQIEGDAVTVHTTMVAGQPLRAVRRNDVIDGVREARFPYEPATDPAFLGPLLAKYRPHIEPINCHRWGARIAVGENEAIGEGATVSEALCRAIVDTRAARNL